MKSLQLLFKCVFFVIVFFSSLKLNAQSPGNWLWARIIAENGLQGVRSTAIDPQGNVVVCGVYGSPTLTIGSNTFTNAGGTDFYVAKYDPNGNVLWARSSGGIDSDNLYAIATDAAGNVFVTGGTNSATLTIGDTTLALQGMILIKYNSAGDIVCVRKTNGNETYAGEAITVDQEGNVLVAGTFYPSSISFDLNVYASPISGNDTYLVKYNNDCHALWALSSNAERPGGIAVDKAGNIYLTASSRFGAVNFGTIIPSNPDFNYNNIYLAKFTSNGNAIWAKTALGNMDDYAYGIDTDDACNVYFVGIFFSDSLKFDNIKLTPAVPQGSYIVKYDSSGNAIWAKLGSRSGMGIVNVDVSGNIYAGGSVTNTSFDIGSVHLVNHSSASDALILKFNSNGDVKWGQLLGGIYPDNLHCLAPDANGDIYYVGHMSSPSIDFGNITLTNPVTGSIGWLAKLHPSPDSVLFCPSSGNNIFTLNAIANNYQWQLDTGAGYTNIPDNINYVGTNTSVLQLANIPSSWYGYKYRCIFDGHYSNEYAIKFTDTWTGAVSNSWEDPLNWSCGTVPDQYTDVIVNTGNVQINSNVIIRTLSVSQGANLNVVAGNTLTVLH